MQAKLITVIDDMTEIRVLACRAGGDPVRAQETPPPSFLYMIEEERRILYGSGFGADLDAQQDYVFFIPLQRLHDIAIDVNDHHERTTFIAHVVLKDHWDKYSTGDTLDVRQWFDPYFDLFKMRKGLHTDDRPSSAGHERASRLTD